MRFGFIQGHWSTMREDVFHGHGTMGCDEEAPLQRAEALDVGDAPQERLLDPTAGAVVAARWSPNRRVVTVDLQRDFAIDLLFFHRGYAEGCAGDPAARRTWYARALGLNPEFSVRWAPVARAALS